jgi:hypothetical protein
MQVQFERLTSINGEALPADPPGTGMLSFVIPNEPDNYLHDVVYMTRVI